MSIQTNSTSPISCIKRLGGVVIKVILMCLYKQIVLVPSAVLSALEVCLYKQIVLVPSSVLNALEVWG